MPATWIARSCIAVLLVVACVSSRAEDVDAAPYVPTPPYIVERMLQMAAVSEKDFVLDLGSGDGRIVITAAKKFGARGMGVDISEQLVDLATTNAYKERVEDKVKFVQQDAFKTDLRDASVVTLYLLPRFVLELRPKMLAELKPGTRIVSQDYSLGDWDWDHSVTFDSPEKEVINGSRQTTLYLYFVPTPVAGTWQLALPDGLPVRSAKLVLNQRYQKVHGIVAGSVEAPLQRATLRGDRIELAVPFGGKIYQLSGRVNGERISGTIEVPGRGKLPFNASKTAPGKAIGWQ